MLNQILVFISVSLWLSFVNEDFRLAYLTAPDRGLDALA